MSLYDFFIKIAALLIFCVLVALPGMIFVVVLWERVHPIAAFAFCIAVCGFIYIEEKMFQ
jgi:hypothetical protein